jgi:hypothetical protein
MLPDAPDDAKGGVGAAAKNVCKAVRCEVSALGLRRRHSLVRGLQGNLRYVSAVVAGTRRTGREHSP